MKQLIEKTAITCVTLSVIGLVLLAATFAAGLVAGTFSQVFLAGWRLVN